MADYERLMLRLKAIPLDDLEWTERALRIAELLRAERTWTNWPQLNRIAEGIADVAQLEGSERTWFLRQAWALNEDGRPNSNPYVGNPDGGAARD